MPYLPPNQQRQSTKGKQVIIYLTLNVRQLRKHDIVAVGQFVSVPCLLGGSVADRLACWTQAQKGLGLNRSRDAVG